MNELTISFEARCSTCGDPLEVERVTEGPHPHVPVIVVEPCKHCIETASDKKAEEAHVEAFEDGKKAGMATLALLNLPS